MRKLASFSLSIVTLVPIVLIFSPALGEPARAATPNHLAGDWATPGLGAVVRLSPCATDRERVCGRLIWAWDPARIQRSAIGAEMLRDFRWRNDAWVDGEVFNPEDGRTYSGSLRLDGDVLRLRGCAGPFCQTQVWRRLNSIPRPTIP
ncbi:MAG: DUF2147 domain-containing protein [Hyphomonadaceae bacterium]